MATSVRVGPDNFDGMDQHFEEGIIRRVVVPVLANLLKLHLKRPKHLVGSRVEGSGIRDQGCRCRDKGRWMVLRD